MDCVYMACNILERKFKRKVEQLEEARQALSKEQETSKRAAQSNKGSKFLLLCQRDSLTRDLTYIKQLQKAGYEIIMWREKAMGPEYSVGQEVRIVDLAHRTQAFEQTCDILEDTYRQVINIEGENGPTPPKNKDDACIKIELPPVYVVNRIPDIPVVMVW